MRGDAGDRKDTHKPKGTIPCRQGRATPSLAAVYNELRQVFTEDGNVEREGIPRKADTQAPKEMRAKW